MSSTKSKTSSTALAHLKTSLSIGWVINVLSSICRYLGSLYLSKCLKYFSTLNEYLTLRNDLMTFVEYGTFRDVDKILWQLKAVWRTNPILKLDNIFSFFSLVQSHSFIRLWISFPNLLFISTTGLQDTFSSWVLWFQRKSIRTEPVFRKDEKSASSTTRGLSAFRNSAQFWFILILWKHQWYHIETWYFIQTFPKIAKSIISLKNLCLVLTSNS